MASIKAMAKNLENLKLVRSIVFEWEKGDFGSVSWAHPEIEFAVIDEPGAQVARGVAAMGLAWREFLTAWEDYRVKADEYRELDGERVLVALRVEGRGKISGLEIGATRGSRLSATLFHLERGKVTRLVPYINGERAVADARVGEDLKRAA
jgi:hypothetical protein